MLQMYGTRQGVKCVLIPGKDYNFFWFIGSRFISSLVFFGEVGKSCAETS